MILQLADHSKGVRAEHNLPVLFFVALMLGGRDETTLLVNFRPPSRHDLAAPCSREHEQLNETGETKMNPPSFFLSAQFRKQAINLIGRGIPAARFLGVVLYALAGVFVGPSPALSQDIGLAQSLKAPVRGDGVRVAAVPLPECGLVYIAKAPVREGRAQQMEPKISFIILGTFGRLPGPGPALQVSGGQVGQGFLCPSFALVRPRVFTLENRQPVSGGDLSRTL